LSPLIKIWGVVAIGQSAALTLNSSAQAFMYLCAGLASLATAYYYITKK
jgi:hypothetical protein